MCVCRVRFSRDLVTVFITAVEDSGRDRTQYNMPQRPKLESPTSTRTGRVRTVNSTASPRVARETGYPVGAYQLPRERRTRSTRVSFGGTHHATADDRVSRIDASRFRATI